MRVVFPYQIFYFMFSYAKENDRWRFLPVLEVAMRVY